jgi:hypothetical protein
VIKEMQYTVIKERMLIASSFYSQIQIILFLCMIAYLDLAQSSLSIRRSRFKGRGGQNYRYTNPDLLLFPSSTTPFLSSSLPLPLSVRPSSLLFPTVQYREGRKEGKRKFESIRKLTTTRTTIQYIPYYIHLPIDHASIDGLQCQVQLQPWDQDVQYCISSQL